MNFLKIYSQTRKSHFFWLTLYYNRFTNPLPAMFAELRKQALLKHNELWVLFFDICIASEKCWHDRSYNRCKVFLDKYAKSKSPVVKAVILIVQAYRLHSLYERKFYKEALNEIEELWEKNKHYVQKREGYMVYLFLTGRWRQCFLIPIYHQTLVWICYLRACLLGRHRYSDQSIAAYEELERLFLSFEDEEFRYWIARSRLDRALIYRDLEDPVQEDIYYDKIIRSHKNSGYILLQCITAMAMIFKSCSLYSRTRTVEAFRLIDQVMLNTEPPSHDYLQEIFISASVTKTFFHIDQQDWMGEYRLCERDIKRFSSNPNVYAKRIVAASDHDKAMMLVFMGKIVDAVVHFETIAIKYMHDLDPIIAYCGEMAQYHAEEFVVELRRKVKRKYEPYKSPLDQWKLFSEFVNPNLN